MKINEIDAEKIEELRENENFIKNLKNTEWDERHRLIKALAKIKKSVAEHLILALKDTNKDVRKKAAWALGNILDERAVEPLNKAINDESRDVRDEAAWALKKLGKPAAEPHLQAIKDRDSSVRLSAVIGLYNTFVNALDKEAASKEFLALLKDPDSRVRERAAHTFGNIFVHLTDKEQATKELLVLTKDKDSDVRKSATKTLGSAFAHLEDKETVIKHLLALTKDDKLQWIAEDTLRKIVIETTFAIMSNKVNDEEQVIKYLLDISCLQEADIEKIWESLIALTKDRDSNVRRRAVKSLGVAFSRKPDKERALKDLIAIMKDKDSDVTSFTALINILTPYSHKNLNYCFYRKSKGEN